MLERITTHQLRVVIGLLFLLVGILDPGIVHALGVSHQDAVLGGAAMFALDTTSAPFAVQPRLTQIAMAVRVEGMIADMVCPRVNVGGELFTYTKLTTEEAFTIPDTRIGRTSEANQVEFGATDVTDKTQDHGLEDPVPVKDINLARAQSANIDPLGLATERTTQLIEIAREQRVATLVNTLGNYDSALRTTLSGTDQWSDYTNSDPVDDILGAMDLMLIRPNTLVVGQAVWTKLRQHPKVVESVQSTGAGGSAARGVVMREAVAALLELEDVFVGRAFYNTAKKGQTASYSYLWGKHAALLHLNRNIVSPQDVVPTFCFTAQWQGRRAGTYDDPKRGIDGSTVVKVVDQVKELIPYSGAGYFFQNAIA